MNAQDELKNLVARGVLDSISNELTQASVLGVGTGSTVNCLIDHLQLKQVPVGTLVSSSERTTERLQNAGFSVSATAVVDTVDIYIDGADEVAPSGALIKGGGGALTQEKVVASMARKFLCIVDESKLVSILGAFPLPIEVIPCASSVVSKTLRTLGGSPSVRPGHTENGNMIVDVGGLEITDPEALEHELNDVPGVVTVGLFALQKPQEVWVAYRDGTIKTLVIEGS